MLCALCTITVKVLRITSNDKGSENMIKQPYETTLMEIIRFKTEDVIATSNPTSDKYELPFVPKESNTGSIIG